MKKSMTILMLAVTLLVGGLTVEAKTPKKKTTKSSVSRTVSNFDGASFLNQYSFIGSNGFYHPANIKTFLTADGFKLKSTTSVKEYEGEILVKATKYVYDGGNVTVTVIGSGDYTMKVDLKFSNSSALNGYIQRMTAFGWNLSATSNGRSYYYLDAGSMTVWGLTVTLTYGG